MMSVRKLSALLVYQSVLQFSSVSVAHPQSVNNTALTTLEHPIEYV